MIQIAKALCDFFLLTIRTDRVKSNIEHVNRVGVAPTPDEISWWSQ